MRRHFVIENISFETLQSFVESFLQVRCSWLQLRQLAPAMAWSSFVKENLLAFEKTSPFNIKVDCF